MKKKNTAFLLKKMFKNTSFAMKKRKKTKFSQKFKI